MKAISLKLWLTERNYPLVPWIDMPSAMHVVMLGLCFLLAAWLIYKPFHRKIMIALIVLELVNILGDQNRLQPWHYQYIFTFFAIAANYKNPQRAIHAIILITIATYLYSGLQKINPGFLDSVWSIHILRRFFRLPYHIIRHPLVQVAGYSIPAVEIIGAMGLLHRKTIKPAALLLCGMHVFILLFLGPTGINYNVVVWPWNVQMMWLLWLYFIRNKIVLHPDQLRGAANMVVIIFWVIMPVAGLFNFWDKFLSSGMYSGKGKLLQYHFADSTTIPKELKGYAVRSKTDSSAAIILTDWCVDELNVASVVESRVTNSITKQLNERYASQNIHFVLTERENKIQK